MKVSIISADLARAQTARISLPTATVRTHNQLLRHLAGDLGSLQVDLLVTLGPQAGPSPLITRLAQIARTLEEMRLPERP